MHKIPDKLACYLQEQAAQLLTSSPDGITAADLLGVLDQQSDPEYVAYVAENPNRRWIAHVFSAEHGWYAKAKRHNRFVWAKVGHATTGATEIVVDATESICTKPSAEDMQRALRVLRGIAQYARFNGHKMSTRDARVVRDTMEWVRGTCGGDKWEQ
jgi:hypothetical protein